MHSIHTIQYVYTYRVRARTLRVAAPRATCRPALALHLVIWGDSMNHRPEEPGVAGTMHTLASTKYVLLSAHGQQVYYLRLVAS